MKTRAGAVLLINDQLNKQHENKPDGAFQWHYGRCELRQLMDYIYGGPPENEEEMIR